MRGCVFEASVSESLFFDAHEKVIVLDDYNPHRCRERVLQLTFRDSLRFHSLRNSDPSDSIGAVLCLALRHGRQRHGENEWEFL